MLNLFSYEVSRVFKSISTYVIILFFAILMVLPPVAIYNMIENSSDVGEISMMGKDMQTDGGIKIEVTNQNENEKTEKPSKEEIEKLKKDVIEKDYSFQALFNNFSTSGPLAIFFTIFLAIQATKDYSSGFIKNLLPSKNYRLYQPLSKLFIGLIFGIILMLFGTILLALVAKFTTGDLALDWTKALKFYGIVSLGLLAISALIILIANFSQNLTTTLVVTILYVQGLLKPILSLIDNLKILPFNLSEYSLVNRFSGIFPGLSPSEFLASSKELLGLALPLLLVYTTLNIVLMRKKDINLG